MRDLTSTLGDAIARSSHTDDDVARVIKTGGGVARVRRMAEEKAEPNVGDALRVARLLGKRVEDIWHLKR